MSQHGTPGVEMTHLVNGRESPLNLVSLVKSAASAQLLEASCSLSAARWLFMTDFQILKKAGVYLVSKMRTIKLFHPTFNENNKKLGRDNAFHAEQAGVFTLE